MQKVAGEKDSMPIENEIALCSKSCSQNDYPRRKFMKVTYATPFLVTLTMLPRVGLKPPAGASPTGGAIRMKKSQSGEASMKTRTLLGLITFGIAPSAVA